MLLIITKASLLAGVGFALAMAWGQTGFAPPSVIITVTPWGLRPRCIHPAGFHLLHPRRTHIQDDIHGEC